MNLENQRLREQHKYERAYGLTGYHMSTRRLQEAVLIAMTWPIGSLVDVGCGRGEFITAMEGAGYQVTGVERVPILLDPPRVVQAWGHDLPFEDDSFDYATSWDVLEHLLPGDDETMIEELARVAKVGISISANNKPVTKESEPGRRDELHINRREYDEWDEILRGIFDRVEFLPNMYSPIWRAWR